MKHIAVGLILALLTGCATTASNHEPHGNLVLYVSNRSFSPPVVDIHVEIDGATVVSQDFPVGHQQVCWLNVPDGSHEIRMFSRTGRAELGGDFVTTSIRSPKYFGHYRAFIKYLPPTTAGGHGRIGFEFRDRGSRYMD